MSKVKYISGSFTRRAWWDDLYHLDPRSAGAGGVQVFEAANDPQPTGLLDAHGNHLFRVIEKQPIGFRALKEF